MYHEELTSKILPLKDHGRVRILNIVLPHQKEAQNKIKALYENILAEDYAILPRESSGHSPSFVLETAGKPFALLKQSTPEIYCSFKKHIPEMPLFAAVWEHELVGYELDCLLNMNHVPGTVAVRFLLDGKAVNGVLQEYIADSKDGSAFYHPEGAKQLMAIPVNTVHNLALSGFLKGLSGAQLSNYLIKDKTIYEIDLETLLMPYNRLMKNLILCRMWILGLPQAAEPFAKEIIQPFIDPELIFKLKHFQNEAKKYSRITEESWQAQLERVEQIQEMLKSQSALTPRALYFALFGGEHLWKMAQKKRYPAIMAFNNLISDPYQHILKDFSNVEDIPDCKRLNEPKDNTQESIDIMNFYRILEGLEPISYQ